MGRTGAKKLVPKSMKNKVATQFCIDGYLVNDVLNQVPGDVTINGAKVYVGKSFSKSKQSIPTSLKKMGVQSLYEHVPAQEAILVFDEVNKKTIKTKVADVCKYIDGDPDKAYFKYIVLDNGESKGKFERCTKEIKPYDEDLRKKLVVLGLTDAEGKVQSLIRDLGAKKYECKIQVEEVRTITCSKMG
ncbi:MAG: hypothetical protein ACW99G_20155 [Candidatus Thorarchaeota archaeon]|jgi:hypothetical protein